MKKALCTILVIMGILGWTGISWFAGMVTHECMLCEEYGDDYKVQLDAMKEVRELKEEIVEAIINRIENSNY